METAFPGADCQPKEDECEIRARKVYVCWSTISALVGWVWCVVLFFYGFFCLLVLFFLFIFFLSFSFFLFLFFLFIFSIYFSLYFSFFLFFFHLENNSLQRLALMKTISVPCRGVNALSFPQSGLKSVWLPHSLQPAWKKTAFFFRKTRKKHKKLINFSWAHQELGILAAKSSSVEKNWEIWQV